MAGRPTHSLAIPEAAQRGATGAKVVLASTASVYSDRAPQPLTESAELAPGNPYARTKLAADHAASDLAATGSIGAVSLRRHQT